jgi:hypothetical protein
VSISFCIIIDSERKNRLDAALFSYNLSSIVNFATRIPNNSVSAVDNFFVDITRMENIIWPLFKDLSDHDAQLITFSTINPQPQNHRIQTIRKINKYAITDFLIKLSYETWDTTFSSNSFLNTYLRTFYSNGLQTSFSEPYCCRTPGCFFFLLPFPFVIHFSPYKCRGVGVHNWPQQTFGYKVSP